MIESDTIKLLRECDAGIKMGIASIDDVLDRVDSSEFRHTLQLCKQEHAKLQTEIQELLSLKKTRAFTLAKQMRDEGLIKVIGRGNEKKYIKI